MEKKRLKKRMLFFFCCIMLSLWIVICYFVVPKFSNSIDNKEAIMDDIDIVDFNSSNGELTSKDAFKLIDKRKNKLNYAGWDITSAMIKAKGDNNTYWVVYTCYNYSGYENTLGVIFRLENNTWKFDIPGFTGLTNATIKKYNFVDVVSDQYVELSDSLAHKLIDSKRKLLNDNTWSLSNVSVSHKGYNNSYYVNYQRNYIDGSKDNLGVVFYFDGKGWKFEFPGYFTLTADLIRQYGFQEI